MNIYVGNLSFNVTEEDLRGAFQAHGTVEKASVITDKLSGQSRGFGFVEMSSEAEAQAAIAKLDGQPLDGASLKVNVAKSKEDRTPRM